MWLEKILLQLYGKVSCSWIKELRVKESHTGESPGGCRVTRELGRPLGIWKATEGGAERSGPTEADRAWPGGGQIRTAAASLWWDVHCGVCLLIRYVP